MTTVGPCRSSSRHPPDGGCVGEAVRCSVTLPDHPSDRSNAKEPRVRDKEPASHTALLEGSQLVRKGRADVFHLRERARTKKLFRAIVFVALIDFLLYRLWASG